MDSIRRAETLARFVALHGVRNTELENLHAGHWPGIAADASDVRVVGPKGEIAWDDVSRISDPEMRVLMLDVEKNLTAVLGFLVSMVPQSRLGRLDRLVEVMREEFFPPMGDVSWDMSAAGRAPREEPEWAEHANLRMALALGIFGDPSAEG